MSQIHFMPQDGSISGGQTLCPWVTYLGDPFDADAELSLHGAVSGEGDLQLDPVLADGERVPGVQSTLKTTSKFGPHLVTIFPL